MVLTTLFSPIFRTTGADFITSDFDETIFDSSGSEETANKAKLEANMAKKEAEKTVRLEAQEKIRLETERAKLKTQKVAEEKARLEAEKAKSEAKEKAIRKAEEKARLEVEKAKTEAEEKARLEAEKAKSEAEGKARLEAEKAKSESEPEVEKEDDPFVTSPFDNSGASNLRDLSLELDRQLSNTGADFITSDFDETIFDSPGSDRQSPKKVPSKKRKSMEPEK